MSRPIDHDRIAKALGSSRVVDLGEVPAGGPLDWLHLRHRVTALRAESAPTIECRLPVSKERWRQLERLAEKVTIDGQTLSPTELARLLLERGVAALEDSSKAG
jgi:hypothetical protein